MIYEAIKLIIWGGGFHFLKKSSLFKAASLIKKGNQIFLIYREIQNGAVAKSYTV
jgi:hypothetical protein